MGTVLIVFLVLFLLGGGGWGYARWRRERPRWPLPFPEALRHGQACCRPSTARDICILREITTA